MGKKTIEDVDVRGKRVLVRVDFNVPTDKETGEITDDKRITAALPTINYLLDHDARIILMSHFGRPKGSVVEKLRLDKVGERLSVLLGTPVLKLDESIGDEVKNQVNQMKNGDIILLENIRFHEEEEKNDPEFAKALASLGDIFVNDAFGTAHRAHASTEGVGQFLPSVAGYLIKQEISALAKAVIRPKQPFVAIIGGAKISDKIGVVKNLLDKADTIIVGGGMANTFLAAQGFNMQKSLIEEDQIEVAREILRGATEKATNLLLPCDVVVADGIDLSESAEVVSVGAIPEGKMALDIGQESVKQFSEAILTAETIMWNGPMGVFEVPAFSKGTNAIAEVVANSKAYSIVGGGDSVAAIQQSGLADQIDHISTGGGASLAFMEGSVLPGLAVLTEK